MPQADTCILKIFSILQDLKIAMKLINTASIQQHLTWWGGAWERKKYLLALLHCNLKTNWHPSDIFIELALIHWVWVFLWSSQVLICWFLFHRVDKIPSTLYTNYLKACKAESARLLEGNLPDFKLSIF